MLGNAVTVKANASGGAGTYQYAFYYKKDSNTKWTVKQGFKANNTVSIQPANAATYSICAKVKDKSGTIEKQYMQLTVYKNIENQSTISASSIQSGNSVKISCRASGGSGFYNYAVYYKKTSDSKWTVKQSYQSNTSVTITPAKIADYEICVKAKDSDGNESKKYFKLSVTAAALANNSQISSENISVSQSVKVTASASGGTIPYTYAFYYKNINGSSWTKKQDFSSNSSVSIKFSTPDTYNICAKVKDQSGTIVKKYFTVTVTK